MKIDDLKRWCVLFIIFIVCYANKQMTGDDLWFSQAELNSIFDYFEYAYSRFMSWEPRLISISIILLFTHNNIILWRVFVAIVCSFGAMNLFRLFSFNEVVGFVFGVFALTLIPIEFFSSAGWMTTSVYYLLPLVMATYVLYLWKEYYYDDTMGGKVLGGGIACFICADSEQVSLFLLLLMLPILIFQFKVKGRVFFHGVLHVCIILGMMVFKALYSPANSFRVASETINWFPEYVTLSMFEKIYLGFDSTLTYIFDKNIPILTLLFITIVVICVIKKVDRKMIIFIMIPMVINVFSTTHIVSFISISSIGSIEYTASLLTSYDMISIRKCLTLLLFVWFVLALFIGTYIAGREKIKSIVMCYVLGLGLLTRIIMGASPTLYASNTRTFVVLIFSVLLVVLGIYADWRKELLNNKYSLVLCDGFVIVAFCMLLNDCIIR